MLTYNLVPFENALAFQVTSQSKQLTDYVKEMGTVVTTNGWKVKVDAEPEVDYASKTIYLRGSDTTKNNKVDRTWNLSSNRERDGIIRDVNQALKEVVGKAKYHTANQYLTLDRMFGNPTFDEVDIVVIRL